MSLQAAQLDADGNGLYDDVERKAMLEALQQVCPSLKDVTFDADGDGKVTPLEQTQDRHPLSMTIGKEVMSSKVQIPWAIDVFPEWITCAYLQEDISAGKVQQIDPRGTRTRLASQDQTDAQPLMQQQRGGVVFASNSGQYLSMPGERDARWNYRWCIFTFRIDAKTGSDNQTTLLELNRGNGPNKSSPKIWYDKQIGLNIQYVGRNVRGLDRRTMTAANIHADGKTWNVVVCGIRYGQMYASVNGVALTTQKPQPERFAGDMAHDCTSYLGRPQGGNSQWAMDALVFGLTEPTEAMVRKMTGWAAHRLKVADQLPSDHPYRYKRPVIDNEDFPDRYVHDNEKWLAWGESLNGQEKRKHAGQTPVKLPGFERVFYDDFRAKRITDSFSGEGDLWMAPGFNTAVGGSAPLVPASRKPDVYPYDAENQKQILSLVKQGNRWRGSAFYSVNDMGHGYTWKGPKIFRIRCMFPKLSKDEVAGGLFPAFWSYDPDFLFWRTANRIENDWFEFDGINPKWLNGLATHYHYAHVKNIFVKNPKSYKRFKVNGTELTEERTGVPGGIYIWDGEYHTWEYVVDDKMFYMNVTVKDENGNDKWIELCRSLTAPTYLQRMDLQLDYALKGKHGTPKDGARQDFVVDFVEVLQKTDQLDRVPDAFAAKPQILGNMRVGQTVTCNPNVKDTTDIRYYWFADGYPLTWGMSQTWKITQDLAGKQLRCMVKAVGARDQPEAWTLSMKVAE
ncbi:MAG: hypothetical protein ACF8OB_01075 [Phycisphaeraceae bacterium JB051]